MGCGMPAKVNMIRKNDLSIGQVLDQMVEELNLKGKLSESRIRTGWPELMGPAIAKYTSSVSLKGRKLYIKVESAPLRQELNYSRDKIKELFNTHLGETIIADVVIF
jgi:Dna[CI] antecedent, DciA